MNLSEKEKLILNHISFNVRGIDENTLYFELELYYNIRDSFRSSNGINISNALITLSMKKFINTERVYLRNGESMVVYKEIK